MPDLNLDNTFTFEAVKTVIETKYNDVTVWANYARTLLEGKLAEIIATNNQFDVTEFIAAAQAAIDGIPASEAMTITYTAPDAPTYNPPVPYVAPDAPTYKTGDDLVPAIPDAPSWQTIAYTAPTLRGTLQSVPTPTQYEAGAAPSTDITFTNAVFSDSLLDALKTKLSAELSGTHTGLGSAEAALFARETARQNAARAAAYTELTTQYSARGFDMPPGALLAKQTEVNNQSALLLSDSSSQIMAESARLAVDYNKSVMAASSQLVDILGKLHDSNIIREFDKAKNEVMMDLEGFKAGIQVLVANADLEGRYIGSVAASNGSISQMFSAEVSSENARMGALSDLNKACASNYSSVVQAETARVGALSEYNRAISGQFTSEIQGAIAASNAPVEINRSLAAGYSAAVQGAAADVAAQGEEARSKAAADEVASRKAMGIADLATKFALSNIESAIRKYTLDVEMLKSTSAGALQLIASSFNTVSTSASLGFSGGDTSRTDNDLADKIASAERIAALKVTPPSYS